jgi:DhnA family fructose-bisphosphate aldolase class Ia
LSRVTTGTHRPEPGAELTGTDLGLYSLTFNNDLDADYASLEAFSEFRADAAENNFKYFLEVFNPNVGTGIDPEVLPHYINDCILRCLAGVMKADRPQFLKIAYNGPKALEELASFDPSVIVGVLGGGAGTTRDCYELLAQAERYGARVALFGRKINLAESPLDMIVNMRAVVSGSLAPAEAVKAYHGALRREGIRPYRDLEDDNLVTEAALKQGLA